MNYVYPDIPEFHPAKTESYNLNTVQYWGFFTKSELCNNVDSLLMLDIDFGRFCSLKCPTCFRKINKVDDNYLKDLKYEKLIEIIKEAKKIGLKYIKICGAGEPLENPLILKFARDLTNLDIGLAIFTKGHVLGDDILIKKIYKRYNIIDSYSLCKEFFNLKTSFMVSFQSANLDLQDKLVGGIKGYSLKRNKGVEILSEIGFNKSLPTRLAFTSNPIVKENYKELFDIYVYCRKRNILPINAALMISGKQIDKEFLNNFDVKDYDKELLYSEIYSYNLEYSIQTVKQISEEGISCLPGIHPCNQIAVGLYLTCNGNVIRCPGDSGLVLGNVQTKSILDIWKESRNWKYKGVFNVKCPYKDGTTIPLNLYDNVLKKIINNN
jgi:MoaA/NifB/PqqE/SkfB family radical SAM enzyme